MILPLLTLALLTPPQTLVTADPSTPTQTLISLPGSGTNSIGPTLGTSITSTQFAESNGETSGMIAIDENSDVWLSTFDGSAWGAFTPVSTDLGDPGGLTVDAAYEATSGRLLIAYRKASSPLIYFRTYHPDDFPSLSSEDWYDLGLGGVPSRVMLRAKPGSGEVLLVSTSGGSIRSALWDNGAFELSHSIETGFDNGPEAIAAEWTKTNARVLWARLADSTPRSTQFDGTTWTAAGGLPSATHAIRRLELAPSNDRATVALLLTMVTSDSMDTGLRVSIFDGSTWSATTTLETQLTNSASCAAAWETSGSAAIAVWQQLGETVLRTARWDSGAWAAVTTSTDLGGATERMIAHPATDDDSGVHTVFSIMAENPALEEYLIYADTGSLNLGSSTTVNGIAGSGAGHTLPDPPAVSAGTTPVSIPNNQTVTLAPGGYGTVSVGNNSTLNLSTGQYVFAAMSPHDNQFTLTADTTAGPVILTIAFGDFDAHNKLTISTIGAEPLEIHVLAGDFHAMNSPVINASIIIHLGDIELGISSTTTAHLIASGSVTVGNESTLDPPSWDSPFTDPSPTITYTTSLTLLTLSAGSVGPPITILDGWEQPHPLPFDLSWQSPGSGLRITSWREIPSYTD